ncbi:NifB/NifX family molybdenum-iron cluster-binding protein [Methanolacinia paynteri]|uniref:NifB/NifX family molybdenum-iron cluster-binding protein n=1 Tax=Methanolacinia paynteri TaxID=230356 RepID=UPI00064FAAB2|nr:NifB/NifX family molybdenum-iron cluster-binding protein [Methanolacinia paynteri]
MKVAVAMEGDNVSAHFGHCVSYAIFNVNGKDIAREEDLMSPGHEPGRLPAFLSEHNVDFVIAGGMGPRAVDLFCSYGIEVILGVSGSIDSAVSEFANGNLVSGQSMCHHDGSECDGSHGEH